MAAGHAGTPGPETHLMLIFALASALNMVAETPLRLAICCPTAARMQHSSIFCTWLMRPALMASENLRAAARQPLTQPHRPTCSVTAFSDAAAGAPAPAVPRHRSRLNS